MPVNHLWLRDNLRSSITQKPWWEGGQLEIISLFPPPLPFPAPIEKYGEGGGEKKADGQQRRRGVCARSLSLPGGKPIDLQFILASVKSMQGDMKSPGGFSFFFLFTTSLKRFLKRFVTADNGNPPCL